ncbi:MAG TPA: hypothetical protein VG738_04350 [Chitinophagaceae bacterium]|nr:hypothetical protein [Chitinophagaceae bacterium]
MKPNLYPLLICLCLVISCNSVHKYKYVESDDHIDFTGNSITKNQDPKIITAASDTEAYLKAYEYFCISNKVVRDMKNSTGHTPYIPLKFALYNERGDDIATTTLFAGRSEREKEIEKRIYALPDVTTKAGDNTTSAPAVDSAKIKDLLKYFSVKKDEFSTTNTVWYGVKTIPDYVNVNTIYCYFGTDNGVADNLRFRIQYTADDWLFFKQVQFSIDGKAFEYEPSDTKTDNGDGRIWEWFDEGLTSADKDLIYALANAKTAKMKLIGTHYYSVKEITQSQITGISRTLDLYKAMGGSY